MEQQFKHLERLLESLETTMRREGCSRYKDILIEIEKVRGEQRAFGERQKVQEGMVTGQFARLSDRLERLTNENTQLREHLMQQDNSHTTAINKINMHLRYTAGGFAALLLLLNFFEKIRDFFGLLLGSRP